MKVPVVLQERDGRGGRSVEVVEGLERHRSRAETEIGASRDLDLFLVDQRRLLFDLDENVSLLGTRSLLALERSGNVHRVHRPRQRGCLNLLGFLPAGRRLKG